MSSSSVASRSPVYVDVFKLPYENCRFTPVRLMTFIYHRQCNFHYADVVAAVLSSNRVNEGIQKACNSLNDPQKERKFHRERAARVLHAMRAKISCTVLRLTGWILHKILTWALRTIRVNVEQIDKIKEISLAGHPVIYLPLHRSHLDYILVTFTLWNYEIRVPHIASGENLNIPILSWFLRSLGAFFIRRRLDGSSGQKDFVYRSVLHMYMAALLQAGESVEIFIEGGRSRTGKMALPKAGLLSVAVDSFNEKIISDAYLVPISISYECLIERNFNGELLGQAKIPESCIAFIKAIVSLFFGVAGDVQMIFAEPILLSSILQSLSAEQSAEPIMPVELNSALIASSSSPALTSAASIPNIGAMTPIPTQGTSRYLVASLSMNVAYDLDQNKALMSTNLLSFLLLTETFRYGGEVAEIVENFHFLFLELQRRNFCVGISNDESSLICAVQRACLLLGPQLL